EFNNIMFGSSAASVQIFTMSTRAMNWAGTLTVSDGSSTTALATANLGLTGGALNVGNGGILTANASTITVSSVTMTGGTSGTITLTTGSVTDSGNWDTSGAGSVFTKGTSTVTMSSVSNIAIVNAPTGGSWSAGTGTIVFNSALSRVMTFGNIGVTEFNNVQFSPTAAATFTMATNGIRWAGTLTLNNAATLATANLALTGAGG